MKLIKFLPFLVLFLAVAVFSYQFLFKHKVPLPADTIIGLYYPFRDIYQATNPNGIPFKNFLITDPVRQQYPWRLLSLQSEKQLQLPLWNPYNFAGTPLLANMQSAVFYPLNFILLLLPFSLGWSLLVLLQPLLAALFLYLYLRRMNISPSASLLGSIAFAFCGFNTAWLEWNTVGHVLLWLPLILLAKEHLLERMKIQWILILVFAECASVFAGHLQTLFYIWVISNTYLIARIIQISIKKHSNQTYIMPALRKYLPFLLIGIGVYIITALQLVPTFQLITQSARGVDQQDWHKPGWFIPQDQLVQFLVPDFFGNPTTLNYWGVWNYGEFIGYIGIIPLIFALFALGYRHDKKTAFFGTTFFLSLLFSLNTWLGQLPFLLNIPFLSTAQPTRLLAITDFSLAILAALGVDQFVKRVTKQQLFSVLFMITMLFAALWAYVLLGHKLFTYVKPEDLLTAKRNLFLPSAMFVISAITMIGIGLTDWLDNQSGVRKRVAQFKIKNFTNIKMVLISLLIIVTMVDLMRFSWKFNPFTQPEYLFPQTKILSYIQKQPGQFRVMTTDDRILPPNFSILYHIQTLDGYDPLYLLRYGELMAAISRNRPDIHPPFGFNRIITPHQYESSLIDLLGVKYILSLSELQSPKLQKVFQNGSLKLYQNQNAYPRIFFVKKVRPVTSKQEAINQLFDPNIDLKQTAITENWDQKETNFDQGEAKITSYKENTVEIEASTKNAGFLVLTDTNYPTWHAKLCAKSSSTCTTTKIYNTNYNFRGIVVPAGEYRIIFYTTII
jgi:hypothetical protein